MEKLIKYINKVEINEDEIDAGLNKTNFDTEFKDVNFDSEEFKIFYRKYVLEQLTNGEIDDKIAQRLLSKMEDD